MFLSWNLEFLSLSIKLPPIGKHTPNSTPQTLYGTEDTTHWRSRRTSPGFALDDLPLGFRKPGGAGKFSTAHFPAEGETAMAGFGHRPVHRIAIGGHGGVCESGQAEKGVPTPSRGGKSGTGEARYQYYTLTHSKTK